MKNPTTITITAAVIIFGCNVLLFNNLQCVLADRDAYLQEDYLMHQLNLRSKKKGGILFGRKKKAQNNNDPAIQYQRRHVAASSPFSNSAFLYFVIFAAWLTALWIFQMSPAAWFVFMCTYISDFTGSFAQRNNEKRRKRTSNNNKQSSPRRRNSSRDDQSITSSVLEIIDLETRIDDDSSVSNGNSHATGFISAFFDSMARATKKFTSTTKSKVVPHNNKESHDSRPHSRKSHRDQSSSLRLRGSGSRKHKSRRDEELGGEDKSGFLDYIVEDDEGAYSDDNGTAFGVVAEPTRSSKSRGGKHAHHNTSSKNHDEYHRKESNGSSSKPKSSPLQRKLSCESEDRKSHRNHHHRSSHNHHHNSHPHHHTEHRKSSH